jgi:hypothetical protein
MIEEMFDPRLLTFQGKTMHEVKKIFDRFGALEGAPEWKESLFNEQYFYGAVHQTANLYIKQITGAQMSFYEQERLLKAIPNVKMSPTQFYATLKMVQRIAQESLAAYLSEYQALLGESGDKAYATHMGKRAGDAVVQKYYPEWMTPGDENETTEFHRFAERSYQAENPTARIKLDQ